MAFAVFLGSNRDPGRGMLHPFLWALYSLHFGQLHPFSPYRVLRCFLAASSPLQAFLWASHSLHFDQLHPLLWLSDLSDLSRVPHGFTPDLCGFGAGSLSGRVSRCSLFVRWCFSRGSLGVHGGQHRGAGVGFWAVYHARGCMRPNKPV